MTIKLRPARKGDEADFYRIKKSLPMPLVNETARGGFLLGTNVETYRFFIENALVNVLEKEDKIVGFAVVLPDDLLRGSDLWKRKDEIEWEMDEPRDLIEKKLCYFEQLAVLPGVERRFYGVALALVTLREAFETHEAMFATIVLEPVFNRASIAFLESVGGKRVGATKEFYPEFGDLVSAIYSLERETFSEYLSKHPLKNKVLQQIETVGEF